jgi:hypothetical protein
LAVHQRPGSHTPGSQTETTDRCRFSKRHSPAGAVECSRQAKR